MKHIILMLVLLLPIVGLTKPCEQGEVKPYILKEDVPEIVDLFMAYRSVAERSHILKVYLHLCSPINTTLTKEERSEIIKYWENLPTDKDRKLYLYKVFRDLMNDEYEIGGYRALR